jgi:4-hydroxy-3-methylbut-2-enyl diphosphate reductase
MSAKAAVLVKAVIDRIRALGAVSVRKMDGIEETIKFPLPKGLRIHSKELIDACADLTC